MKRLDPIRTTTTEDLVITSISIPSDMMLKVDAEVKRVGTRSRSELFRMILDLYFEDED